jgi:hypothetical protein
MKRVLPLVYLAVAAGWLCAQNPVVRSNIGAHLACPAASSSGTTYTCATSPTFTPAANDCVLLVADVASGASPTLAVNGAAALGITKQQNGAALVANDLLANGRVLVCMDAASHWQMQGQTGNAASGGVTSINGLTGAVAQQQITDIFSSSKPAGVMGTYYGSQTLGAGATGTLLATVTGSGYVSEIFVAVNQSPIAITVTVDGEATPSISAYSVQTFLGDGLCDISPSWGGKWIRGGNNGANNCGGLFRIPIPFSSSILIQAKNNSANTVGIASYVVYHTGITDNWIYTQRLYNSEAYVAGMAEDTEGTILDVTPNKRGRLVGVGWIYDGAPGGASPSTGPLEGPFKIYIDGSGTAAYRTSGSEDFFGMPWYFQHLNNFGSGNNTTLAPSSEDIALTFDAPPTFGAQRFFIQDPIVFNTGIKMTWTCGVTARVSFSGTCLLFAQAWYYTEN